MSILCEHLFNSPKTFEERDCYSVSVSVSVCVSIVYSGTDQFSYLSGATDQEAAKLDFSLFSQTVSQSIAGSPGNGPSF